ncbi:hypothetical protein BS78_03G356600 [Paspalum vaginatum]|nr:hypothetical protein BS78_03G356600 [Paspalum vaginatum]
MGGVKNPVPLPLAAGWRPHPPPGRGLPSFFSATHRLPTPVRPLPDSPQVQRLIKLAHLPGRDLIYARAAGGGWLSAHAGRASSSLPSASSRRVFNVLAVPRASPHSPVTADETVDEQPRPRLPHDNDAASRFTRTRTQTAARRWRCGREGGGTARASGRPSETKPRRELGLGEKKKGGARSHGSGRHMDACGHARAAVKTIGSLESEVEVVYMLSLSSLLALPRFHPGPRGVYFYFFFFCFITQAVVWNASCGVRMLDVTLSFPFIYGVCISFIMYSVVTCAILLSFSTG